MQSKDLRIGNFITVNGETQVVCDIPLPENCTIENTIPINLTKEWLLSFGFTGDENIGYRILINQRYNLVISDLNNVKFEFYGNDINAMLHLEYVHELQNLYFALTGEELFLKNESKP